MARQDTSANMAFNAISPTFDPDAFDNAIEDQGIPLVHYRALPCPVGLLDMNDPRKAHTDHSGCSNGFLYKKAGVVSCIFMGQNTRNQQVDNGMMLQGTARVTPNRFYTVPNDGQSPVVPHGEEVILSPFDRLYLDDVEAYAINWQLFEHNESGLDRLQYPVLKVEHLVDADGKEYVEGTDFAVDQNGQIKWIDERPGYEIADTGPRGKVCSIRYRFKPFWYVKYLEHEIRVAKTAEAFGARETTRMPFAAVIQREIQFENEQKDVGAPDPFSLRQVKAPSYGSFSAR